MQTTRNVLIAGLAVASLAVAESKIQLKDAPPAVQAIVQKEIGSATFVGLSKETEKGKVLYELETKSNGLTRDLTIAADGSIASVEQEVSLDSIPPAAKAALLEKAGKGKISKVEEVNEDGKKFYEARIKANGKTREFSVDANGKPLQ